MEEYELNLCGLSRKLPLVFVGKKTRFASFSMLGDVELVDRVALELERKLAGVQFDYFVGPEVKVVPLLQELSRRFRKERFVVCRKSVKPYMVGAKILKPLAYFPKHVRQLVIDGEDAARIEGKKVVVVDDVVSTGVTMRMMKKLMADSGAEVVRTVAVLKQGETFDDMKDLVYLGQLPIFQVSKTSS